MSTTTKKDKEVTTQPVENKTTDSPGWLMNKYYLLGALALGIAITYLIRKWTTPPLMPEYDLNKYWGAYPMDPKPDLSIQPYSIEFSDVIVNDLRERLLHRRPLPQPLEHAGFTYGFNSNFLTQVVDFWANSYKFKDRERFLNQYKHYTTRINGLNMHYMHVRPKMDEGFENYTVPIVLLHGWPGSVREFYELIPRLTKITNKNFVFEVVVPSLPGFGFSEAPTRPGFGPMEMAIVIRNLMARLGYKQYYVQGGDLGHTVGSIMATMFPREVRGFHTNFPAVVFNPMASVYHLIGAWFPWWIESPDLLNRLYPIRDRLAMTIEEMGYFHIQATKPDTIGTALSDSPAGLAAYILEKFSTWTDPNNKKAYDGNLIDKFSLTHLLDNVMIYWTTNTITTSMRIYAETVNKRQIPVIFDRIPTEVPTWGIKFRHELVHHSDRMLSLKYKNYLQSTVVEEGGHFAALENPEVLARDIFEAVDAFKHFHERKAYSGTEPRYVYDFTVNNIKGEPVSLETYKGFVLLLVNVASRSYQTEINYKKLSTLDKKFHKRGLRILAFPCPPFEGQRPGPAFPIKKYAKVVTYDILGKIEVKGENIAPLWAFLTENMLKQGVKIPSGDFEKFLIDRHGLPVIRFRDNVDETAIEDRLNYML